MGEMDLDRVHGDEQRGRDLLVRQTAGGKLNHPPFGRSQLAIGSGAPSGHALVLGARQTGPARRAQQVESRRRVRQRVARRTPLLRAPLYPPEGQQRARCVEPQPESLIVAGDRAQRHRS